MIDRTHLNILLQVHRHGTLTKAADVLCLTQSALSHAIRKLETEIGTAVWQKSGRNLRLTQAGLALLNLAERVLPQFAATEQQLTYIATGKQGMLRIGMECHPCYQWLLGKVTPYLDRYNDVELDVRQAFKFGGLHALHNHEIDLLITPDPLFLKTVNYIPLFDYEQVLVTSLHHPLANQESVTPQQLTAENLITYPIEPSRLDILAQFITPAGVAVKSHKTLEATEIILKMVSANRGVTALPKWLVLQYQDSIDLAWQRLGKNGLYKTLYIGHRQQGKLPEYIEGFIKMAKEDDQVNAQS
jgi:LysR family transcriptional regulator for metE and metH